MYIEGWSDVERYAVTPGPRLCSLPRQMDLSFSPQEEAFKQEVSTWIRSAMPSDMQAKADEDIAFDHEDQVRWHKILHEKGWVAPQWPHKYGGPDLDVTHRFILSEELALSGAPTLSPFGLSMVGPLLMQFGSDAQKERYLPKILSGEEYWCQGYSEPGAGSDLASLRMSAVDDGDGHFVVNGQKTWTTYAQHADWIFCLVRTNPDVKKQAGISFLLIDMKSPGVEVRPMLTLGHTPAFCDTFFEEVKVPKENLVGPLNGGWGVAKALLGHERTLVAQVGISQRALMRVKRIAAQVQRRGKPLAEDPTWRAKIARMEIKLKSLQMTNFRTLASAKLGRAPGPESSILKLRGSEILQDMYELAMELMGHNSLSWFNEMGTVPASQHSVASIYCYNRATTIYAGSSEIQKNIIAKMILGLPS